jgi:hypothetical protein
MPRPTPNLVGSPPFGRLTVLRAVRKPNGRTAWECRCDCGAIRIVETGSLISGRSTNCGGHRAGNHPRRSPTFRSACKTHANQEFHDLVTLRMVHIGRRTAWICRCKRCDRETAPILTSNLRRGNTKSCGCRKRAPTFGGKGGRVFPRTCRRCGTPFVGWFRQHFCDTRCAQRWQTESRWPRQMKFCPVCGKCFLGRRDRVYCDDRCKRIAGNQSAMARAGRSLDDLQAVTLLMLNERAERGSH